MENKVYMVYEDDYIDSISLFREKSDAIEEMMKRAYNALAEILDDDSSNSGVYWEDMTIEEKDKFFKEEVLTAYHIKEMIIDETNED